MTEALAERVLVVPTDVFRRVGHFQGVSRRVDPYLDELFRPEHTSYRPRHEVEQDPSFKQIIPYVIFRHLDQTGLARVFQYRRGTGQGEGRLHGKRSVGIGGHISAEDASASGATADAYREGMQRELDEEVHVDTPFTSTCVGLINDDDTPVGRVHLGVVYQFDVERPEVHPRETEIVECGFRPVEDILTDLTDFETWSQLCMRALFGSE